MVGKWRQGLVEDRLDGLFRQERPGAPRKITDEMAEKVVAKTLEGPPRDATRWSLRSMTIQVGMSPTTTDRIWRAFGLQPQVVEDFKVSTDPRFLEKARDVVGL